jgi:hypothetical protein
MHKPVRIYTMFGSRITKKGTARVVSLGLLWCSASLPSAFFLLPSLTSFFMFSDSTFFLCGSSFAETPFNGGPALGIILQKRERYAKKKKKKKKG